MTTLTRSSDHVIAANHTPARRHSVRRRRRMVLLGGVAVVLIGMIALGFFAAGRGYKTQLLKSLGLAKKSNRIVKIAMTMPEDGAVDVADQSKLMIAVRMNKDRLDKSTVNDQTVRLYRAGDQKVVPASLQVTAPGRIEITPGEKLEPLTNYNLLASGVETLGGATVQTFLTSFTTAGAPDAQVRFSKTPLPLTEGLGCTVLTIGPDHKLYCGTDDGTIHRFAIAADGTLTKDATITSLQKAAGGPRLLIGLVFDPKSTPDNLIAWATHNFCGFENVPDFTGVVSRLSGPALENVDDVIVGLPRSIRDHATNQPAFGPDGALYIPQPSNTAFGAPDAFWGMRPEHMLNASILRLDTKAVTPGKPIDVRTPDVGGSYDPAAPGAPLTIYATGVRLAYELIWHSNGQLYAPTNGASLGGNAPAGGGVPALNTIPVAEDDWLHRVQQGKYHGHPNPAQGHYVLNGGNPTQDYDFAETPNYPVGTKPDANWVPAAYVMGQHISANGVIEYQSNAFGGALKGKMLICRYSRGCDLFAVEVNANGDVVGTQSNFEGLTDFVNPLDVIEDPATGNLYVSEYGARKVTLCRPK